VSGDVVVRLPESLRGELKDPLGPIYTDTDPLLSAAGQPVVAVGDIVTYHLLSAGHIPAVALADERTERSAIEPSVRDAVFGDDADADSDFDATVEVDNPAGTLTADLLSALTGALDTGETTLIVVDGEEDMAALLAVLAVGDGASVVYGQPGEGMVLVDPDEELRAWVRSLIERMDGDTDRLFALVDAL